MAFIATFKTISVSTKCISKLEDAKGQREAVKKERNVQLENIIFKNTSTTWEQKHKDKIRIKIANFYVFILR